VKVLFCLVSVNANSMPAIAQERVKRFLAGYLVDCVGHQVRKVIQPLV